MKNPYEVLGVASTATLHDIKRAYRKLAKLHHPDLNPGNKEAELKFKEISHAFDLVGTEEARGKYDRGENDDQQREQAEKQQRYYRDTQGPSSRYSQNFEDNVNMDDLFSQIFGSRGGQRARPATDETYQLEIDLKTSVVGGEKVITLPSGKSLQVKIPAGIEEGKKLRFKGMGAHGDVLVEIKVAPDEKYKRVGNDLHTTAEVSFFEAALGGEISVPTLEGNVLLKVPAGVSSGSKLRIRGKGAGSGDRRGNQIVTLKISMPKEVSPELAASLKDLATKFGYDPRSHT